MRFTIPGEPTGKGRPRVTKWGTHTPEKTVLYENLIKTCCPNEMLSGELHVHVKAYYQIPKSTSKKNAERMRHEVVRPTKKPDCDNVLKIICDALNKIAYNDDSQIVSALVEKFYADVPRVEVEIGEV